MVSVVESLSTKIDGVAGVSETVAAAVEAAMLRRESANVEPAEYVGIRPLHGNDTPDIICHDDDVAIGLQWMNPTGSGDSRSTRAAVSRNDLLLKEASGVLTERSVSWVPPDALEALGKKNKVDRAIVEQRVSGQSFTRYQSHLVAERHVPSDHTARPVVRYK